MDKLMLIRRAKEWRQEIYQKNIEGARAFIPEFQTAMPHNESLAYVVGSLNAFRAYRRPELYDDVKRFINRFIRELESEVVPMD